MLTKVLSPGFRLAANPTCKWRYSLISRAVSSGSHLYDAFNNSRPSFADPPRSHRETGGLFLIPELSPGSEPEGFATLRDNCVRRCADLVREACDNTPGGRRRIVAAVFDDLSDELCRVADMAEFVRVAHPKASVRQAAQDASTAISGLVEELNTHLGLYEALKKVVEQGDAYPETNVDRHVAKLFLLDFQQCGIHLDDEDRRLVVRLNDAILRLGQQFFAGAHAPPSNGSKINDDPIADDDTQSHRAAYQQFYSPSDSQEQLLTQLLSHRHHLAQLCGYETFAHRAMAQSLAGNPENVLEFLNALSRELQPRVKEDYDIMLAMKRRIDHGSVLKRISSAAGFEGLEAWDAAHYAQEARATWFPDLDPANVSQYFSLGACMEGLNMIFKTLFSVELVVEKAEVGELWHKDVYKLAVVEANDNHTQDAVVLGHIYCDFFTRPGKPSLDCHYTIKGGCLKADGSYQNPVVVLMLNLPGVRNDSSPVLLTGSMLDNLFHEMGHAMHSMLGRTKYQHVTGTRCSTDFAEVPSTLMEYFCSDPRIVHLISRHCKSGERMPMAMARRFCASKRIFLAADLHTQLCYALADQALHGKHPLPEGSPTGELKRVHERHHVVPFSRNTAWHQRFTHLVGYGARYYSYLMARAVAASIWRQYFAADPLSPESGAIYRQECLVHGGGKPSRQLVNDFLRTEVNAEFLTNALIEEVDRNSENIKKTLEGAKGG